MGSTPRGGPPPDWPPKRKPPDRPRKPRLTGPAVNDKAKRGVERLEKHIKETTE